jgi:DNA-binding transcriptional regulator YdaS (Cro superfamily)
MKFQDFWNALPRGGKRRLADRLRIKFSRLSSIAHGRIPCGPVTAMRIERATEGIVPKEVLAPHVNWSGE